MKNKEKYDLKELSYKWVGGDMLEVGYFHNNKYEPLFRTIERTEDLVSNFVDWLEAEYKEPILDDEEKEYLKAVIRPWKHLTVTIKKTSNYYGERIVIRYRNKNTPYDEIISLPIFERDTMYKGMELNEEYNLRELGLWK